MLSHAEDGFELAGDMRHPLANILLLFVSLLPEEDGKNLTFSVFLQFGNSKDGAQHQTYFNYQTVVLQPFHHQLISNRFNSQYSRLILLWIDQSLQLF